MNKTILSPASILLPSYEPHSKKWEKWAVIACDQFTSQPEYWNEAESFIGSDDSTLSLILPEAYLETAKEANHKVKIKRAMKELSDKLHIYDNSMIYLERILPDSRIRYGIIGKVDLEEYDFSPDSSSGIRATEQTVIERIPPRVEVRREAEVELPHVMIFFDDIHNDITAPLTAGKDELELVYDFPLMQGGGRAIGYRVSGDALTALTNRIASYENAHKCNVIYAMGDGNHSLASAKAYYEELKKTMGDAALTHPARYALVEAVNLHDASIEFEPIYRILKDCDAKAFLSSLPDKGVSVTAVNNGEEKTVYVPDTHPLAVGSLQNYIDMYIKSNPFVKCDYIHGEKTLKELSSADGALGFLCTGIDKAELFSYVEQNGTLPRKTFSMGEAKSKRYYLEARKIVK